MPEDPSAAFIHMPLKSLVDLVVNSPTDGMVNFHILHTILHVVIHQMHLSELSVELHGPDAERLNNLIKSDFVAPTMTVQDAKEGEREMVVVDPLLKKTSQMSAVTSDKLNNLIEEVEKIKRKVSEIEEMPSNLQLIEATRSETGKTPVADMCQIVNLMKRLDAAEIGMQKLAGIVEDAVKNPLVCATPSVRDKKRKSNVKMSDTDVSQKTDKKHHAKKSLTIAKGSGVDVPGADKNIIQQIIDELDRLRELVEGKTDDSSISGEHKKSDTFKEIAEDVRKLKEVIFKKKNGDTATDEDSKIDSDLPPDVQLAVLEERFKDYTAQLQRMDDSFNDELTRLHNQFTDIERDFNEILLKIQGGLPAGDGALDEPNQCCTLVFQKMVKLEGDLDFLAETSTKLLDDKDEKSKKMDEMLEQIEMLKVIKADKEEMEEALADKADTCAVHRKVSHVQFEGACDELSKGIEEALDKLTQQEILWQHALEEIQNEIGSKLDKMDLGPLREFINNKLRMLQDKMKSLAALKKEQEAAGTKSRFLRNVNCISCDKDVVMRKEMDSTMRPTPTIHPPTRSIGPYLAYELDALRKQQKGLPGSKNLNQIEAALGMGKKIRPQQDHICNRYCGGSHTVTTPQQRVTRLGHFLMQWGPEAVPAVEEKEKEDTEKKKSSKTLVPAGGSKSGIDFKQPPVDIIDSKTSAKSVPALMARKSTIGVDEKKASLLAAKKSASKQSSLRLNKSSVRIHEEIIPELPAEEVEATEAGEVTEGPETIPDEGPPPSEAAELELVPDLDVPPEDEVPTSPPPVEHEQPEDAPDE